MHYVDSVKNTKKEDKKKEKGTAPPYDACAQSLP